jgi:hypothetical protein
LNLIHDYGDLNRIHLPFFSHIRRHSVDDWYCPCCCIFRWPKAFNCD